MSALTSIKAAFNVIFGKTLTSLPEPTRVPPMPAVQTAKAPLTSNTTEQPALNISKGNTMDYILLVSTLINSIKTIESLMPKSPGTDKFNAVIAMIEAIFGSVAPMLPQLQALATVLVTGFNAVGIFVKKTPVAA